MGKILNLFIFLNILAFAQEFDYKRLLLNRNIKCYPDSLDVSSLNTNLFVNNTFNLCNKDSVKIYITEGFEYGFFSESDGSCLEIKYFDKDSLRSAENKIIKCIRNKYNSFSEIEYKSFKEFIGYGIVIATSKRKNKLLIINVHSCIFKKNLDYVLNVLKKNDEMTFISYFECGGKNFGDVIKHTPSQP